MSLTFTDWENCTDSVTGQVFWLNWTADTGMGLYTHLEGFRQALVDKYAMTGTTLTGLLASEIPLGTCKLKDTCAAIDAGVTAMITKFVNHLDNGGNWQGQATCAPVWTSATILTAIGAASRILSGDKKQITVEWMKQVRALLDMMRWVKYAHVQPSLLYPIIGRTFISRITGRRSKKEVLSAISWVDAVSQITSLAWEGWIDFEDFPEFAIGEMSNEMVCSLCLARTTPDWFAFRGRSELVCSTLDSGIMKDVLFYIAFDKVNQNFVYENNDYSVPVSIYETYDSFISTTLSDFTINHGDFTGFNGSKPTLGTFYSYAMMNLISICKFDVPGGSKFF